MNFTRLLFVLAAGLLSPASPLIAQEANCHSLVVEVESQYPLPGSYVRARIYARPSNSNDRVFMVFGDAAHPLELQSNQAAYNSPSSFTNETVNSTDPFSANDSYVTIGQFQSTASAGAGSTIDETNLYPLTNPGSVDVANALAPVFNVTSQVPSGLYYAGVNEIGWGISAAA